MSVQRFLMKDSASLPANALDAAIEWLEGLGGGTVVSDLKSNLMNAPSRATDARFDRFCVESEKKGVHITWSRKGIPYRGNVVAAYASRNLIERLDERTGIERLFVLGWHESDWRDWAARHDPAVLELPPLEDE